MTKVRKALSSDSLDFALLAKAFLKESKYPFSLDLAKLLENFEAALKNPDFCLFLLEDEGGLVGMLVGGIASPLFSTDRVATELAWFVDPSYRDGVSAYKLLASYEKWAVDIGCTFVTMIDIDTLESLEPLYTRKGYTLTEKTYVKEI